MDIFPKSKPIPEGWEPHFFGLIHTPPKEQTQTIPYNPGDINSAAMQNKLGKPIFTNLLKTAVRTPIYIDFNETKLKIPKGKEGI